MRLVKIAALLAFSISLATPIQADAQFGKIRKKMQDRAKERLSERAEEEAGKRFDRALDKGFDKTVESIDNMVAAALSKGSADVDLENNVIRQEGQEDIELKENETSPANADYVHYLQVTKLDLPGALGKYIGNGSYERIYLHGDKQLTRSSTSGTLVDLDKEHMVGLDYEDGTYFIQPFADIGEMLDLAVDPTTLGQADQMPDNTDQPEMDMEFDFEVRKGGSGIKRGSRSEQSFIIVKSTFESEAQADEGEEPTTMRGTVYSVTETWTTNDLAGVQTMTDFGMRAARLMGAALEASESGRGLQTAMLSDPRIGAAMEEASRKLSELEGYAVESEMFVVLVPEGKELDLDRVLAKEPTSPDAAGGSGDEQVTMFSSMTFISNLSTEAFDLGVLDVADDMTQTKSPLEMLKEAQSGNGR